MKKFVVLGGSAIALAVMACPNVAAAQVTGTDPELDAKCMALLKPAAQSEFTAIAIDITTSSTSTTEDDGIISTVGIGTPTYKYSNFRGAHVNGQSVNIFAYADLSVVYAAGALETIRTKITTITTRTGTCHVHKPTNGADNDPLHPGYSIAPPGLQIDEPVTATSTTVTYGTRTETIPGPWTDPNASTVGGEVVICNSPGRNPGTWRAQNGYDGSLGQCSTAWYNTLGSTPSVSVPTT